MRSKQGKKGKKHKKMMCICDNMIIFDSLLYVLVLSLLLYNVLFSVVQDAVWRAIVLSFVVVGGFIRHNAVLPAFSSEFCLYCVHLDALSLVLMLVGVEADCACRDIPI